jgi:hypothetical protein
MHAPFLPAAKLHLKRDAYTKVTFPLFVEELSRPGQTSRQLDEKPLACDAPTKSQLEADIP